MRKRNKTNLIIALCVLSAVLAMLLTVVITLEMRKKPEVLLETTGGVQTWPEDDALLQLETPYCTLFFPQRWEKQIHVDHVEGNGYRVEFSGIIGGERYRLFDVSFGSGEGTAFGTVEAKDGSAVEIYICFYEPEKVMNEGQMEIFWAMQEGVNALIDNLSFIDSTQEDTSGNDVTIQTPYGQLNYSGEWKNSLYVEHVKGTEYDVNFYAVLPEKERIRLFTVTFSPEVDDALLVITDDDGNRTGVYLAIETVENNGLNDEQMNMIYAMQDAANDVLDTLNMD